MLRGRKETDLAEVTEGREIKEESFQEELFFLLDLQLLSAPLCECGLGLQRLVS